MIQSFLGIRSALQFEGSLYVVFTFSLAVFMYGGYPFLKGFVDEVGKKQPGMMTLIALAITVAFVYSSAVVFGVPGRVFFWEVATLIDVMLLGHWVEMRSVMGASRALEELASLMPSEAHKVKENGETEEVALDELKAGDRVLVKPGEKIPADGKIIEGESSVNEAMVTGESTPVTKKQDDEVIGGSVNGEGSLTVEVQKTGEDSFRSQVMNMVQEAQQSKSRTQNLADRAAFWLTVIALTAGVITLVTWLVFMQREFVFALERTVTVMVITCPHALGLAIPLVVAVSTAISAKNGLLIRNRGPFERARNLQAIIFDKTGTLTKGTFEVTGVKTLSDQWDEKEVVRLAASVEQNSEHPIAKGIVEYADNKSRVSDFKAITGKGAQGKVDNQLVKVVSEGYLHENTIQVDESQIEEVSGGGKTLAFVIIEDQPAGVIALSDVIRDESREAIRRLKDMGIQSMMLTGDNKKVAESVARELELDDYFAEVLPDDKADKVKEVQSRGLLVAMTGDGVNDAPALAQADIGIAIGAGTDVAVETADIILVKSNPMDAVHMIALSRATYRKMLQNLAWATGYNAIAIPLAAGVLYSFGILLSPAVGAVLMSLSTVIVAINARFLKYKETDKG
jgi:Cu2+-exporting ATPase